MAARRHERTYARKQAVQILYQAEIVDMDPSDMLQDDRNFVDGAHPSAYAARVAAGVSDNLDDIDSLLERYSENWAVDRMPAVDRAILRLAAFVMAFVDEVPVSVSINEAVELAKEFGGEDESPRFVNGVLGRIAEFLEQQAVKDAEAAEAEASGGDAGERGDEGTAREGDADPDSASVEASGV
jgi:N utilization substance protein B